MSISFRLDKVRQIQMGVTTISTSITILATGVLTKENGETTTNKNITIMLPETSSQRSDFLTIFMNYLYGVKGFDPITGIRSPDILSFTLNERQSGPITYYYINGVKITTEVEENNINIDVISES